MQRNGHLYVCASTGTLRVPAQPPLHEGETGAVPFASLPPRLAEALRERGLAHRGPDDRAHPVYGPGGKQEGRRVAVAGEGPLATQTVRLLHRAGLRTGPAEPWTAARLALLPLDIPEETLTSWTRAALDRGPQLLVHLCTPTRLLLARLDPPRTPCPVCLVRRLRANHLWQAVADLPLGTLFGAAESNMWPTTAIAAGVLAHTVLAPADGSERPVLVDLALDSLERTEHRLLHTPACPACASHAVPPAPGDGPRSLHESWERMRGAVDPLTGIVPELRVDDGEEAEGSTTYARTAGETTTKWFSAVTAEARGGAVKSDPLNARVCAVGETMERYAAGVHEQRALHRATLAELGEEAVDPRLLPLGSAREYATHARHRPFDPRAPIDWVEGRSLTTGRRRYLPACAVHLPYRFPRGHRSWFDPISTGLAAGASPRHAVFAGVMEVVERDSSVVFWENRLTLPTLDFDRLPKGTARGIVERLRARGISVTGKDLTTDLGIPAFGVRLREGTPERPVVVHAARADLDPHAALLGALEEACLGHAGAGKWQEQLDAGARIPHDDEVLDSLRDFSLYYWHPDRVRHLAFWDEGPLRPPPEPRSSEGLDADVTEAVARLAARGYETVTVDLTPIDVAECGVSVVRTVVPGLCPITLRSDFHRRGGPRVLEAPVAMGVRAEPRIESQLNPYPLPFL